MIINNKIKYYFTLKTKIYLIMIKLIIHNNNLRELKHKEEVENVN
jgi:hypothetical protein